MVGILSASGQTPESKIWLKKKARLSTTVGSESANFRRHQVMWSGPGADVLDVDWRACVISMALIQGAYLIGLFSRELMKSQSTVDERLILTN